MRPKTAQKAIPARLVAISQVDWCQIDLSLSDAIRKSQLQCDFQESKLDEHTRKFDGLVIGSLVHGGLCRAGHRP